MNSKTVIIEKNVKLLEVARVIALPFLILLPLPSLIYLLFYLDVDFLRQVIPTETWFTVTYGLCLTSGLDAIGTEPECSIQLAEYYNPYGCQFRPATDEVFYYYFFFIFFIFFVHCLFRQNIIYRLTAFFGVPLLILFILTGPFG